MKYAIYKNRSGVGLTSWKYAENEEEAKEAGALGLSMREFEYPILVNERGGSHTFCKNDRFIEIRDYPLTREERFPKDHKLFDLGWISPEGNTYSCEFESHYECAEMLCEEMNLDQYRAELVLEEAGWIKVTRGYRAKEKTVYAKDLYVTKKQVDTLFDLGLYNIETVREMVKSSEGRW